MGSDPKGFFQQTEAGVQVHIRLTPKAASNRLGPIEQGVDGGEVLKAGVTTVPEGGKANQALIKLLSKSWKIPKSAFDIVQGATDRNKVLVIKDADATTLDRLSQWRKDNV